VAEKQMKLKIYHIIFIILLILFLIGLFRREFKTVYRNALQLCLSCMGLQ
jgi:hypothetical protein